MSVEATIGLAILVMWVVVAAICLIHALMPPGPKSRRARAHLILIAMFFPIIPIIYLFTGLYLLATTSFLSDLFDDAFGPGGI